MKNCEDMLDLISLRLDGELTREEELELAEHLASCPECRALADDLADIHAAMPGMSVEPPAFIMEHVMERIREAAPAPTPFPVKKDHNRHWRAWGASAAALVLVAVGVFALWGGPRGGNDAPMTLAEAVPTAAPSGTAAVNSFQGVPEPQPSAVPSAVQTPMAVQEPASEPVGGESGKQAEQDKTDQGNNAGATAGVAPRSAGGQTYSGETPPSLPCATPAPSPSQQLPSSFVVKAAEPLTAVEAAKKLYEEKFATLYPDYDVGAIAVGSDGYVACHFSEAKLEYVRQTTDGTSYLFKYTVSGEATAWYLVPLDGSEIQTLDSEPVE